MTAGRLLVVDDNEMNRDMLSRRLERQGHAVTMAENGRQALERIRAEPFDLVLLDIMMPELNGYEVLEQLKNDGDLRHIPVIMISAGQKIRDEGFEAGAFAFIAKPFAIKELMDVLGKALEFRNAIK